jgi:hypothetical protein
MVNVGILYDHLEYFTAIWYDLWPFGIVCGHLLHYIFSQFGMFGPKKSGNPAREHEMVSEPSQKRTIGFLRCGRFRNRAEMKKIDSATRVVSEKSDQNVTKIFPSYPQILKIVEGSTKIYQK